MKLATLTLAATLVTGAAFAAEIAPSDVQFDEYGAVDQSLTGTPGNPEEGEKIMTNRGLGNCVACHEVSALDYAAFQGNVGPSLDGVADRWNEAELRGILVNAKKTYDGTVMPSYYRVDGFVRPGNAYTGKAADDSFGPLLTAQQVEDVVAFLGTLEYEE
ncbi:sulfur oxidation c-type cytochrome SoxX [Lutimaribacter sp. EGI FJ00015]|uniref:Sulfur oxidation c-type cytochrome SoxX n=1 Tax=Lutimaribacter degradans TaxID=2945989 RepID=A0ACC5ZVP1_9RHOB|nr:sulfur oxidation c-type cytochrome SoxX [Lutimaribacter sp. EGI FJ00013]MCM2562367.1 sulfur oxidation c-type cytochrome SoxX [Lutimaribacter sp. EGI FJ00013]MCO0613524.1 sulfur oxidation c-type cytochrome SoxX [Lutimaribacter sp. EGI FJ00015]MCO0636496.1 sulfur oxidation c-type cytochrome SoxX [Lutimaribacter sp. EGI FJ00014]